MTQFSQKRRDFIEQSSLVTLLTMGAPNLRAEEAKRPLQPSTPPLPEDEVMEKGVQNLITDLFELGPFQYGVYGKKGDLSTIVSKIETHPGGLEKREIYLIQRPGLSFQDPTQKIETGPTFGAVNFDYKKGRVVNVTYHPALTGDPGNEASVSYDGEGRIEAFTRIHRDFHGKMTSSFRVAYDGPTATVIDTSNQKPIVEIKIKYDRINYSGNFGEGSISFTHKGDIHRRRVKGKKGDKETNFSKGEDGVLVRKELENTGYFTRWNEGKHKIHRTRGKSPREIPYQEEWTRDSQENVSEYTHFREIPQNEGQPKRDIEDQFGIAYEKNVPVSITSQQETIMQMKLVNNMLQKVTDNGEK